MKYLKRLRLFTESKYIENGDETFGYWKIPTGDKLLIALNKINTPEYTINNIISTDLKDIQPYIWVRKDKDSVNLRVLWGYSSTEEIYKSLFLLKYLGEVTVDQFELDSNKYNL